ncbi:hypothetical protein EOM09_00870 [bacterium]|nr:hypothetical protein [bacterium]
MIKEIIKNKENNIDTGNSFVKKEQNNYSIKNLLNRKPDRQEDLMKEILEIKKEVKKIRKIMFFNKVIIFVIVILIALGVRIGIEFLQPIFEDYARSFNSTIEVLNNIPY